MHMGRLIHKHLVLVCTTVSFREHSRGMRVGTVPESQPGWLHCNASGYVFASA
jgi:hypothetical protein